MALTNKKSMANFRPTTLLISLLVLGGCASKQTAPTEQKIEASVSKEASVNPKPIAKPNKLSAQEADIKATNATKTVAKVEPKAKPVVKQDKVVKLPVDPIKRKIEPSVVTPKPKIASKPKPKLTTKPTIKPTPKPKIETVKKPKPVAKPTPIRETEQRIEKAIEPPVVTLDALPLQVLDWTVDKPAGNSLECVLHTEKVTIKDNAGGTPVYLSVNSTDLKAHTKSDIDLSYPNSALSISSTEYKFESVERETNAVIKQAHSAVLMSLNEASEVTIELGFWPSWPQTQSYQAIIPTKGFKVAFNAWKECNRIQ